jgi:hypothetical protein
LGYVEEREGLIDKRGPDAMDLYTLASFVESDQSDITREEAWAALIHLFKIKDVQKFTKTVQFF